MINTSAQGEQRIAYTTKYKTSYALFFQTGVLKHICRKFQLFAVIRDERIQKSPRYILRWDVSYPGQMVDKSHADIIDSDQDNRVSILGGLSWLPKGSEYILTLNSCE